MKKIGLLILCAFFCSLTINSYAQSVTSQGEYPWWMWFTCEGEDVTLLGSMHYHWVDHYNPTTGEHEWRKFSFKSDNLTHQTTGEVFSCSFYRKVNFNEDENVIVTRFNLLGNEGSHILVYKVWVIDPATGAMISEFEEAKCK